MYCEELKNGKVRFGMSYTDTKGKSRKVSVTMPRNTATYRREAEQKLNEKIRKALVGENPDALKLGELVDLYLEQNRPFIKEVTHQRNKSAMNTLCDIVGSNTNVSLLTARRLIQAFQASGRDNSTLNELQTRFKAMWRWAYRNDYVPNVAWLDKLKPFPALTTKEKNAEKYLERDELQALLPELKIVIARYAITMLVLSGLRIGELLALTKDDVDFEARQINVDKTYNKTLRVISEGAKTYASNRKVYMQDELYALCAEIRDYYAARSEELGFTTDLFLCDLDGNRLNYDTLNKYFRENCERVIGRRLSLHSLRHSHASLMFEAGASLEAVSARLGHSNSAVTRDIYIHITQRKQEQYNAEFKNVHLL